MIALLMLLGADHPRGVQVRHIERLELNRVKNSQGCVSFVQWIAWVRWDGDWFVRAWCLERDGRLSPSGDGYVFTRYGNNRIHVYRVREYIETTTRHDPEVADRDRLSKKDRLGW